MSSLPQHHTILLVDDDPEQASLFAQVLALSGYQITTAPTAESALAALQEHSFDLLLIDWDLPGMKGDELIRLIRHRYPKARVVMMSNHVEIDAIAEKSQADGWYRKRDDIRQLRQLIRAVLDDTGR